jgi:cold shock CspA family protein
MLKGQVIFFREVASSGYLRLVDTREEFHFRLPVGNGNQLTAGDWVSFQLKETKQGVVAVEVKPLLVA